ncbi:hypothetical protein QBC47DRAFT_392066 [Echria macrotheca]|uniref:Uncharacterized protein n=1 Tax=Echria macrotheca TaxID=438768 RepID=A0AAJ0F7C3_9PEZI|nr:hypothetical protein QBC47DRAFT_392066 [Echria macrotheca]
MILQFSLHRKADFPSQHHFDATTDWQRDHLMSALPASSAAGVVRQRSSAWPRSKKPPPRGNTNPTTASNDQNTVQPGQIKRFSTAPIFRDPESGDVPVIIKSYALPWAKLKTYLEETLKCDLSQASQTTVRATPRPLVPRPPKAICDATGWLTQRQMLKDSFTVRLPRELTDAERAAIEGLRVKTDSQRERLEKRPEKTESRPLDSDEEE